MLTLDVCLFSETLCGDGCVFCFHFVMGFANTVNKGWWLTKDETRRDDVLKLGSSLWARELPEMV
jgi:hypothetical protein